MKILHISISDSFSGSSIAAHRLHSKMIDQGIDSKMLVLLKSKRSASIHALSAFNRFFRSKIGLYLDKFYTRNTNKKWGSFSFSYVGIPLHTHPLIQEADVVYFHWINGGLSSIKQIARVAQLNKTVFLFAHDMWYFTGGCHQSYGCEKYMAHCFDCHFFQKPLFFDLVKTSFSTKRKIYKKYPNIHLICPSNKFYEMICSGNIIDKKNIHCIPNLIDEKKYHPVSTSRNEGGLFNIPPAKHVILFGAMGGAKNSYKGWNSFVDAMSIMSDKYPDDYLVLLFGYDFEEKELEQLPFRAFSIGNLKDDYSMIAMYNQADVYVFPSHYESFGQTMYEALCCGIPVVAFENVGAVKDLIEHTKNGYIAEYLNSTDLANGIHHVLHSSLKVGMKTHARYKIETAFSSSLIVQKHIHLINEINKNPGIH